MKFGITILIASIICASCAFHPYRQTKHGQNIHQCVLPIAVMTHQDVEEEQADAIRRALVYWNNIGEGYYFYHLGKTDLNADDPRVGRRLVIQVVSVFDLDKSEYDSLGCARIVPNPYSGCSLLQMIKTPRERFTTIEVFESIVRHELGHILGLNDLNEYGGIMTCEMSPQAKHPIEASQKEIEALNNLY